MISQEFIIAAADKSILKISGIHVRGLNTQDLERRLSERLHTLVRVIGVTGEQIEMDVYGIDPAQIRKDEKAVIQAISLVEGISAEDLCQISVSEKIIDVNIDDVPDKPYHAAHGKDGFGLDESYLDYSDGR